MGAALTQAQSWLKKRRGDLPVVDSGFIDLSAKRGARARRAGCLVTVLAAGISGGFVGWFNRSSIKQEMNWFFVMRPYRDANFTPYVLTLDRERALKPGDSFRECAEDCPEMIVLPARECMMGSPNEEKGRYDNEGPQHKVTIARPFAVSKYDVTFAGWDSCERVGGCPPGAHANGWGRESRPVIFVSWDDAIAYVRWLSSMTGKAYRLLTEAEWEYAARAGTTTAYSWGDEIGKNNEDCDGCGSQWDGRQTALVGSFAPNAFGLFE
jgi:formylglycine-generating enzyme required for sulfatase activity